MENVNQDHGENSSNGQLYTSPMTYAKPRRWVPCKIRNIYSMHIN